MTATLTTIDPMLKIEDVCRLLKISKSQFYELRADGRFGKDLPALIEVQPPIDRSPRFQGGPFCEWLGTKQQTAIVRKQLRAVR